MRLGQRSALAFVLVVTGCGGGEFGGFSGRLVPMGYSDGEGVVHVITTFDRVLDLECSVMNDEVGNLRCLPRATISNTFADAECSEPITAVSSEEPPRFVSAYTTLGVVVYEVRDRHLGEVYLATDEGCANLRRSSLSAVGGSPGAVGIRPSGPATYYHLTRTDPRIFAPVSPRRDAVSGGVDRITHVAEDGSEIFGTLEDRRWGRACRAQWLSIDGEPLCGPEAYVFLQAYASPTCDGDVLAVDAPSSLTSAHVWTSTDHCASPVLAELGRAIDVEATYSRRTHDGVCHVADEVAESSGLREATVVDPFSVLPPLEYVEEGEGRLVARHVATSRAGIVHRNAPMLFDRELGARCTPESARERTRCLPRAYLFFSTYFRDAECRVPVRAVSDVEAYGIRHAVDLDGRYHRLSEETLPRVYSGEPGACHDVTTSSRGGCETWRVVGDAIDDDFAELSYGPVNAR